MKTKLLLENSSGEAHPVLMERNPFIIGRVEGCDFVLSSRTVSRRHCELKFKRKGLTIKDLGSRNGTVVNDTIIEPNVRVPIKIGDRLRIGKYTVTVAEIVSPQTGKDQENAETDSLLKSLEAMIFDTIQTRSDPHVIGDTPMDEEPSSSAQAWKTLRSPTSKSAQFDEADINKDSHSTTVSLPSDDASDETATSIQSEVSSVDPSEARRLALRARLESLKAKDSKEAANRALKNFFGGRS